MSDHQNDNIRIEYSPYHTARKWWRRFFWSAVIFIVLCLMVACTDENQPRPKKIATTVPAVSVFFDISGSFHKTSSEAPTDSLAIVISPLLDQVQQTGGAVLVGLLDQDCRHHAAIVFDRSQCPVAPQRNDVRNDWTFYDARDQYVLDSLSFEDSYAYECNRQRTRFVNELKHLLRLCGNAAAQSNYMSALQVSDRFFTSVRRQLTSQTITPVVVIVGDGLHDVKKTVAIDSMVSIDDVVLVHGNSPTHDWTSRVGNLIPAMNIEQAIQIAMNTHEAMNQNRKVNNE